MRSLVVISLLLLAGQRAATPVGDYRLATVDGVRVPMIWRQLEQEDQGAIQLHWISGGAEVRRDGTFAVSLTMMRSGKGFSGTPEAVIQRGTWRILSGFRVELRFSDGRVAVWDAAEGFARLVLTVRSPDLDGQYRIATMVLVRS
ncbi:MAG TPA: hypothetical protein VF187_06640 [Gemmatimonadales bacterium]